MPGTVISLDPLVRRIAQLATLAADEEDQEAIRSESLTGLFRFLHRHRRRVHTTPQLVLTPQGHLRAEWRRSKDCRVAVRFLDDRRVSFVSFLPDRNDPAKVNRTSGGASIDGFFDAAGVGVQALSW